MDIIRNWFQRYLSDPQVVLLAILILISLLVVVAFGQMLIPLFASIVLAYLLEAVVQFLVRKGSRRITAVIIVCSAFLAVFVFFVLGMLPLLSHQISQFMQQLPDMIARGVAILDELPTRYQEFVTEEQILEIKRAMTEETNALGKHVLSISFTSLIGLITLMVYLILVPLLLFFLLKDKDMILRWFTSFLPKDRMLAAKVWRDADVQIGNYVRGKFIEIAIMSLVTYVVFTFMELKFAVLLSVIVGVSAIVPVIGITVVTIPVLFVAYFQWGFEVDFFYVLAAYAIIQLLDGNVLVPLLFSEVVNLHPIAIIVAVLVFGGVWGFWGVFFAIPLATCGAGNSQSLARHACRCQ